MNNEKMPIIFIGHGSPMNIIEDSQYVKQWIKIRDTLPEPKGILSISAHWYTRGNYINNAQNPAQIYDFYGFPEDLYKIKYEPQGLPDLAKEIADKLNINTTSEHGIDHGTWCPLKYLYPNANIPTTQLSINGDLPMEDIVLIGEKLKYLREKGILILCSGNIVHNLRLVDFNKADGFPWAYDFDKYIKENIIKRNIDNIINYKNAGECSRLAFVSLEHYLPLLYALGASDSDDKLEIFAEGCELGSISMTSYIWR